jgi:hypothetical protein
MSGRMEEDAPHEGLIETRTAAAVFGYFWYMGAGKDAESVNRVLSGAVDNNGPFHIRMVY